jgi:hypothetical protein
MTVLSTAGYKEMGISCPLVWNLSTQDINLDQNWKTPKILFSRIYPHKEICTLLKILITHNSKNNQKKEKG